MSAVCSPIDPGQRCSTRIAHQQSGEMFYHWRGEQQHGWLFPSDRTVKHQPAPMFYWRTCPFCGGRLPDLSVAYGRFLRALEIDGEEGG